MAESFRSGFEKRTELKENYSITFFFNVLIFALLFINYISCSCVLAGPLLFTSKWNDISPFRQFLF